MGYEINTRSTDDRSVPENEEALDERLSRPTPAVVADLAGLPPGDLLILGAGGKMGPSLARMARRALDAAGQTDRRVVAVARFSDPAARALLEAAGVHTHAADLSDRAQVAALPDAGAVIFMAGQKFGTAAAPEGTWMMNTYVPALVAERYAPARTPLAAFSTGCVYPNTPVARGGSREDDALEPVGDYANSCVGRERTLTYFCRQYGAPLALIRLNYAVDLRYGVLVDVARKVRDHEPIDLAMGHANVIWQGDANAYALRALALAARGDRDSPLALNVTGPETVSIREAALRLGALLGRSPAFTGEEADTALLSNAGRAFSLLGYPSVSLDTLLEWVAAWIGRGGRLLGKPTHYETRDGRY
jgi:Nucleoside-diphosphate-sugar epimerases